MSVTFIVVFDLAGIALMLLLLWVIALFQKD